MHSKEHLKWLEENELTSTAVSSAPNFKKVLRECLGVKNEQIAIVTDHGFGGRNVAALMASGFYIAAKELKLDTSLLVQLVKNPTDDADLAVREALETLSNESVIILSLSNKLGSIGDLGKSFRKFAQKYDHRFVSSTSLGALKTSRFSDILKATDLDYGKLQEKGAQLKELMDNGSELNVKTKLGTDITFDIDGKEAVANTASYLEPGKGGNIPAGEVYMPPKGKEGVYGKVVIDGSVRHKEGSRLCKNVVTLKVEDGSITDIEGGEEAELIRETILHFKSIAKFPKNISKVGEIGIGINPSAKLIGSTILDEKVAGTAHIAFGSNAWFGGDIKTLVHADQVFKNPEITIDGKLLKL